MNTLTKLFKLLQITRSQPQYGYALAGIKQDELSNLAEHHYLVTFIAWQLASRVIGKGANINLGKTLEFALVHDLGELFGGDIGMPYAKANPKARELAKAFEGENQQYLSQYFGDQQQYFMELSSEVMEAASDESLIAKLADYIEVTHYKQYVNKFTPGDVVMAYNAMIKKLDLIKNHIAKEELKSIVDQWKKDMENGGNDEFFEQAKFSNS